MPQSRKVTLSIPKAGLPNNVSIYSLSGDELVLAFNADDPNQPPANCSGSKASDWVWRLKQVKK